MSEPLVYLNGRFVPAPAAHLAIYDAGVVLGATVTEQERTFRHRPWRLEQHLDRLFGSLEYAGFEIGLTRDQVAAITTELIEHNARLLHADDELGVIQFVTAGELPTYAGMSGRPARTTPTVCIHTFPLPFEQWARKMRGGAHLITPSIRQVPPECYDTRMKCRSRMHYYLADREARRTDPEAAALLLDLAGNVTETSTANFLIVQRGAIVSPTARNILHGISRATVIELAGKLGLPFEERDFPVETALEADEALLTSTPYCLMPVTKINGRTIGQERPGDCYQRLLAAWSEQTGVGIAAQIEAGAKRRSEAPAFPRG